VAPPQTLLGELTVLPQTPSWMLGGLLLREGRGRGREGCGAHRPAGARGPALAKDGPDHR